MFHKLLQTWELTEGCLLSNVVEGEYMIRNKGVSTVWSVARGHYKKSQMVRSFLVSRTQLLILCMIIDGQLKVKALSLDGLEVFYGSSTHQIASSILWDVAVISEPRASLWMHAAEQKIGNTSQAHGP